MDETDALPSIEVVDPETRRMLGMFDAPAFARRGMDLEQGIVRLHERLGHQRLQRLEMVHLRLKQWAAAVTGPQDWARGFESPLDVLWVECGAPPPAWGRQPATDRKCRSIARDLHASVNRFNRNWERHLGEINLHALNLLVDHYNRYYLVEKECVMRSARLAARLFTPKPHITAVLLLERFPLLAVPPLAKW